MMNTPSFASLFILPIFLWACQPHKAPSIDVDSTPAQVELWAQGTVSTGLYERDLAITPDGNELIYTLGDHKQTQRGLVGIRNIQGTWSQAEFLNISGVYQDIEPFFADEGKTLFFASNRPTPDDSTRSDYNIWYSQRQGDIWGSPHLLDESINTTGNEFYPSVSKNGNLYFTATRKDGIGREDIFVAEMKDGQYQEPRILDSTINTKYYEFNAYIHPDEDLLIFSSFGRTDDLGGGDLYYSVKDAQGRWQEAKHMGPDINSDKLDYCPFIDVKRNNFYFTSERRPKYAEKVLSVEALRRRSSQAQNGMGDIYKLGLGSLNFDSYSHTP